MPSDTACPCWSVSPLNKVKRSAAQRRPAESERKNCLFLRNDRPYGLKCKALQTENPHEAAQRRNSRRFLRRAEYSERRGKRLFVSAFNLISNIMTTNIVTARQTPGPVCAYSGSSSDQNIVKAFQSVLPLKQAERAAAQRRTARDERKNCVFYAKWQRMVGNTGLFKLKKLYLGDCGDDGAFLPRVSSKTPTQSRNMPAA